MLGPDDVGKRKVLKSMPEKENYEEKMEFKHTIHQHIIHSMSVLINALHNENVVKNLSEENQRYVKLMASSEKPKADLTCEVTNAVKSLWSCDVVKRCFEEKTKIDKTMCNRYFFDEVERIGQEDFIPNENDILLCPWPTAIHELYFELDRLPFRFVNNPAVQPNKHCYHMFSDVIALMYHIHVSEDELKLPETELLQQMENPMKDFEEVINCSEFEDKPIIFVFNAELDALATDNNIKFLLQEFRSLNKNTSRKFYHFVLDPWVRQTIFTVIQDIFVSDVLDGIQLKSVIRN